MRYLFLAVLLLLSGCRSNNPGPAGPRGATGPMGASCTVTKSRGESIISCPDGTSSAVEDSQCDTTQIAPFPALPYGGALIECGNTLSIITNGSTGQTGAAGSPGTTITPIQFCPGFVQSYPNVFAESGICINNTMYGVYSANSGFLAELPPGRYSSNGINSSCSFTIYSNCIVGI